MSRKELARTVEAAICRVFGWEDAENDGHRVLLTALIRGLKSPDSTVLCEPSLARRSSRPPDVVLVDPIAGVHVIEVKSIELNGIEALEPGGQFRFQYAGGPRTRNPISQVRSAMFDMKDAAQRHYEGELSLPFKYWVVLPRIGRQDWFARWGHNAYCPPELLFAEDVSGLAERLLAAGKKGLAATDRDLWPSDQLAAVCQAFGDSAVLYHRPDERERRPVREGTLGEHFDEAAEAYKTLSEDQQTLSAQDWSSGPRLIRGVAGSGKTIVLANNLARRFHRSRPDQQSLFAEPITKPRLLAVCFNRTLAPFLRKKIGLAYQQRTGETLADQAIEVTSFNQLLWRLSQQGLWRYQSHEVGTETTRAQQYLTELQNARQQHPDTSEHCLYDAIYVDEGQDFDEEEFRLLAALCKTTKSSEPNLYVFYDDAQNLYGRARPNWQSLGLNVRGGRAHVMTRCFRNTRAIVEAAFNVLYGSYAEDKSTIPTKEFGAISTLEEQGLIEKVDGAWQTRFAVREGLAPKLTVAKNRTAEAQTIVERVRWLVIEQRVRPQDILVLAFKRYCIEQLATELEQAKIPGVDGIHVAFKEREKLLGQRGVLSLSTVASAKGYDAYCVLLASANEFSTDLLGRASFYVGCTRAIEYLEVFGYSRSGLVGEFVNCLSQSAPTSRVPNRLP